MEIGSKKHKKSVRLFTSECVSVGHPDKVCDYISDSILTEVLKNDKNARVAVETFAYTDGLVIAGEVSTTAEVNYEEVARRAIREIGYIHPDVGFDADSVNIEVHIDPQSPDIALGTNDKVGGAGDQGLMFGGAVNETSDDMPLPITIARAIIVALEQDINEHIDEEDPMLRPDAKSQVTLAYGRGNVPQYVDTVVVSCSHSENVPVEKVREYILANIVKPVLNEFGYNVDDVYNIYINPTGRFAKYGPAADVGLTGRKIIVDTYGGYFGHGGGAFCIPKYQVISTDKGYKRIKDVNVGDTVSVNGVSKKVINKFEAGVKEAYRLHTKNGYSADMSLDHKVKVIENDKEVFKPLRELAVGDWVIMAKTYSFGDRSVPEAYLMGYVIGDGWLSASDNSVNVKLPRFDRGSRIEDEFNKLGGKLYEDTNSGRSDEVIMDKLYYCDKSFREKLESYGMSSCGALNKKVPLVLLEADKESVVEFLRGLFDSDGCVSLKTGNTNSVNISFTSSSIELCRGVQVLLLNLGIRSRIQVVNHERDTEFQGRVIHCNESYSVVIQGKESIEKFKSEVGFSLARKQEYLDKLSIPSTDRTLVPGCISYVAKEYYNNKEFRKFLSSNSLDSIRKTITNSGSADKRAQELTKENIRRILEAPISKELCNLLETRLQYEYDQVESATYLGLEDMADIEVEDIHEFVVQNFVTHNSGKDPSKVDRSAAYMARYLAKNIVASGVADRVEIQLAYAIGVPQPVSINVNAYGTNKYPVGLIVKAIRSMCDLTPAGITEKLSLRSGKIDYAQLSVTGHFGEFGTQNLPWENTDLADSIKEYCENNYVEKGN